MKVLSFNIPDLMTFRVIYDLATGKRVGKNAIHIVVKIKDGRKFFLFISLVIRKIFPLANATSVN